VPARSVLPGQQVLPVQPERKASPEQRVLKVRLWSVLLAPLAVPDSPERKA